MSDTETRLNSEFDAWFAKVQALSKEPLGPSEDWAELWFDGYTPEEALEADGAESGDEGI
jgi:hypothetical protein